MVMRLEQIYSIYEKGILKDINFTFEEGKFYYVMVQNANIAQAIFDVIALLGPIMEGKYIWQDKDISGISYREKINIRLYNFGLLFKEALFDLDYNIYDNLRLALYNNKKINMNEKDEVLNALIKKYGLEELLLTPIKLMNVFDRQLFSLVRALSNRPKFIIANDPTGNMKEEEAKKYLDYLAELKNEGKGIIIISTKIRNKGYANQIYWYENKWM